MWWLRGKAEDGTMLCRHVSRTRVRELQAPGGQRVLVGPPPECLDSAVGTPFWRTCPSNLLGQRNFARTVVPADNACLFTSVHYVIEGGVLSPACAPEMRRLTAQIVASDPDFYSEAILGKTNQGYCDWIKRDDTWGGAMERSILSKFYQCEVDTQTVRIDRFGEDVGYTKRVLLIYDGIHYDPLQRNFPDPDTPPLTIFSSNDDIVLVQALELADEARKRRQFTDVHRFTLRCTVCQKGLTGQAEARKHAKETDHSNFGEV
ncbi:Ubiquitin thioesterase OTU1 [Plecturocebus cupreus]